MALSPENIGAVTWRGPDHHNASLGVSIPSELTAVLAQVNGFILFNGALHVRGLCSEPEWHSIERYRSGQMALQSLYSTVRKDDIPFAQDCFGDQFLLRQGVVHLLRAETGEIENLGLALEPFWLQIRDDPVTFLGFNPNRKLEPGQLLFAYPPFCVKQSHGDVAIRALATDQVITAHAKLAREIGDLPDGTAVELEVID